jgi:16S rRNA (uracil1498-N3)-methyltransferase
MPKRQRDTASSNTYRFFVDPGAIAGGRATVDDSDLAQQIAGVLRLTPGDRVVLLDGLGTQYVVVLDRVERRGPVTGVVELTEPAGGEPRAELTLYLPLVRPERFEWALQKGVELGVAAFVPTLCARSFSEGGPAARKLERWRRIVREAAEQSRRGRLPRLEAPTPFAAACVRAAGTAAVLLWEGAGAEGLRAALRRVDGGRTSVDEGMPEEQERTEAGTSVPPSLAHRPWSILSGPEGGLSDDERRAAADHGIIEVSLGPRTLRAETAPIVAAAALFYELGELE